MRRIAALGPVLAMASMHLGGLGKAIDMDAIGWSTPRAKPAPRGHRHDSPQEARAARIAALASIENPSRQVRRQIARLEASR